MAVTYNKINWDEETPITVANLDRIDVGIDEVVTQSNSNESRITTNEDDISNIEDGTTKVPSASQADNATEADNSQAVRGLHLELVESGEETMSPNSTITINLSVSQPYVLQWRVKFDSFLSGVDSTPLVSVRKGREYVSDEDIFRDILEVKSEIETDDSIKFIYEIYVIKN